MNVVEIVTPRGQASRLCMASRGTLSIYTCIKLTSKTLENILTFNFRSRKAYNFDVQRLRWLKRGLEVS